MVTKKIKVFIFLYFTYSFYYFGRLNFSIALPSLELYLGYSKFTLGFIAGFFSLFYALGQFINGQLASKRAKILIIFGLLLSSIMNILFINTSIAILLMVIWSINGYAQSTGWPSVLKIIGNWFRLKKLGLIGGLFGSCFLVGNMLSWPILGWILTSLDWRAVFWIPSLIFIFISFIFYLFVKESPENKKTSDIFFSKRKSSIIKIFFSKKIISISIAYSLLQIVRSGFTLWAPFYIFDTYNLSIDIVGYTVTAIPLGGIVGAIVTGWISDKTEKFGRMSIVYIMILSLSLLIVTFYNYSLYSLNFGILLLFLSGFSLYGPHVLLATTIPMEQNEDYGTAKVAGFIDGIGYISLLFANPFVGWILDIYGWNSVITFWLINSLSSSLIIILIWIKEKKKQSKRTTNIIKS
jgi:sugar phosphate permease